jgi:peptide/nickel transport system permease protein
MLGFIIQRFLQAVVVMAVMSVIVFCGVYAIGNPIDIVIPPEATEDIRAEAIRRLGLDRPLYEQYFIFVGNLLQGDLGRSFVYNIPVLELIGGRLPATLELVLISVVSATVLGVGLGIYAGYRPDSWVSKTIMAVSVLGFSVPSFWVGLILILFFAVHLGWLPTGGYIPLWQDPIGWLRTSTMPALSLALLQMGLLARITRSTMLEVLRQDYIRTARAKGLPGRIVVVKHALTNALIPITTVVGIIISLSISGAVVTESLFSIPGMGQLLTQAVLNRDYPMVQGGLLLTTTFLVMVNILVDIAYAILDPRVRYERA